MVRKGPYGLYDPHDMPEKLKREYFNAAGERGQGNGTLIFWKVASPGGPFQDSVDSYTVENYGERRIALNKAVDEWMLANGATVGETVIIHHWW